MSPSNLADFIPYTQERDRICPRLMEWNDFYAKIGGSRRDTASGIIWDPMPPLVLSAWNFSNDDERQKRFQEHLAWSAQRGTLHIAETYLRSLPEEAWHHRLATKPHYL